MAFLRKRGKYWYIYYYDPRRKNTRGISTKKTNRKEAEIKLKDFLPPVDSAGPALRKTRSKWLTRDEAKDIFLKYKKIDDDISPATEECYKWAIKYLPEGYIKNFGQQDFREIKLDWKERKLSRNSMNFYSRHLSSFFTWLIDNGYYEGDNPVKKIKYIQNDPRPIPPEILKKMLQYLKKNNKIKQYNLLAIAYLLALRKSEAVHFRWEDFSVTDRLCYIRNTKGKRVDAIPMLDDILSFVQKNNLPGKGKSFPYTNPRGIKRWWYEMNAALGVRYSFQQVRQARATDLANTGINALFLQKFMRHRSFTTTQKAYFQINQKSMLEGMNNCLNFVTDFVTEFDPEKPKKPENED